jgi:predicted amidophosphoribosyltransferase
MGKPSVQALPAERWRCLRAGGALASMVLPAGCRRCEQLLTRASRLSVCKDCLASFSRIRGDICGECGATVDAVSGDDDEGGQESCSTMCASDAVKRPCPDKHLRASNERWEAVRGAFATPPGSQGDKRRVLLVDDVMTTGATLDACAKALREAGATSVAGLTVARAILSPQRVGR